MAKPLICNDLHNPMRIYVPLLENTRYYGHLVLRLLAGLVLLYTARVVFQGRVTMEELVFSVKHHWRFLDSEMLELQALSWDLRSTAA
jgi:hypothetical protein